ncbi:Tim44/TimA family putative adaptor protein [Devosia sp.]|jgi:predicted lipid-binding transport protein (Tim44 family)|uniref:Tim44/TimA family putative adaptor protein n=1 Tax=Devosia sp. TaxID=1871048 RepID=UPI0037BE7089
MDEFLDIPTLIVIGLAIFVLYRLRSVLGTRTGNERPPVERNRDAAQKPAKPGEDTVVQMRPQPAAPADDGDAERKARKLATEVEQFSRGNVAIAEGLKAIADADPAFGPKSFMEGAKQAYEMIVTAFAQGDRQTLRNLLEKDVYDGFERAIKDRETIGHTVDFTFVGLPKVEITEAELDKRNANVTIRFDAEVVQATRDKAGALIEGNADQVQTISDEWTFARNPKSRDPNWKLVATNQIA